MATGRRTAWWIAAALLLLGATWALYALFSNLAESGPELDINEVLLPALSLTLVVLALGLAGILIRNLVRLIVDRKRGILGARLRTKLVFFFLALVLLPATILFFGSANIIKQTVEAILRTPLEDINRKAQENVDDWNEYFQDQSYRRATTLAQEVQNGRLLAGGTGPALERLLLRWEEQDELQLIWVVSGSEVIARAGEAFAAAGPELELRGNELVLDLVARAEERAEATRGMDYWGEGLLAHATVPLTDVGPPAPPDGYVIVGMVLPTRLAENLAAMNRAAEAYARFRAQRREMVRLYFSLIGLVFLLTLFVATWIGMYLSRRITVPIHEVSAAAREISAGNLDVRVRAETGDEIGMLVDAFNEMAAELQENREVITRSTADLRRSNRALDERRRYIEALLANLSTAVLSVDPLGRVTTANPAVHALLGVEAPVGRPARHIFNEHGLEPLAALLERVTNEPRVGLRRDLTLPLGSGALNVAVQISPLRRASGEDLGTLIMVEDLTDLLRAQKAAAWREVARRIAHEIKNPLTPIQLSAQRLRKKVAEGATDLEKVVPEAAASIEREVGALKRLVDEFSRFARMPELALEEVELGQLVESVLTLYQGHPEIQWRVEVDPAIGAVTLDPEQMRRVLINLIDNAVAAMSGQGTILISARPSAGEGTIRIEVSDTGPGLPVGDQNKVFSPYFSTKKRGTGLGLAIVHKIVTDHRGTIRVEEVYEGGVRFVIEIPG